MRATSSAQGGESCSVQGRTVWGSHLALSSKSAYPNNMGRCRGSLWVCSCHVLCWCLRTFLGLIKDVQASETRRIDDPGEETSFQRYSLTPNPGHANALMLGCISEATGKGHVHTLQLGDAILRAERGPERSSVSGRIKRDQHAWYRWRTVN